MPSLSPRDLLHATCIAAAPGQKHIQVVVWAHSNRSCTCMYSALSYAICHVLLLSICQTESGYLSVMSKAKDQCTEQRVLCIPSSHQSELLSIAS